VDTVEDCGVDITQADFASRIGVSQSYLSAVEDGHNEVRAEVLLAISREFGKSREWLLTGEGYHPAPQGDWGGTVLLMLLWHTGLLALPRGRKTKNYKTSSDNSFKLGKFAFDEQADLWAFWAEEGAHLNKGTRRTSLPEIQKPSGQCCAPW